MTKKARRLHERKMKLVTLQISVKCACIVPTLQGISDHSVKIQKQPSRDVLRKRCSENMQQMYSCFATLLKLHFSMDVLL